MATSIAHIPVCMAQPLRGVCLIVMGIGSSVLRANDLPPPAYRLIAKNADVPAVVLYAVALQESGMTVQDRFVPWPWTLNLAGTPQRYKTRTAACDELHRALTRLPSTQIDVGLGQVNLGYQAHRYTHACDVLDPYRNLAMAADILREQYLPTDNWLIAIGHYHRPAGGIQAARYRQSVQRHLTRVLGVDNTTAMTF